MGFRSFLVPLLFAIYINDLANRLSSSKLFADDLSLFYFLIFIYNGNTSTKDLNKDLLIIGKLAFHWK